MLAGKVFSHPALLRNHYVIMDKIAIGNLYIALIYSILVANDIYIFCVKFQITKFQVKYVLKIKMKDPYDIEEIAADDQTMTVNQRIKVCLNHFHY